MKNIIILVISFVVAMSLTGCGKKLTAAAAEKAYWQEIEVIAIEAGEFNDDLKDAGYRPRKGKTASLGSMAVGILGTLSNLTVKAISSLDRKITSGPGAILTVDRLDNNLVDKLKTRPLRLEGEELDPDGINAVYLQGARDDKIDIEIGTHIAGLFLENGKLVYLNSDLELVGKSYEQTHDDD